MFAAGGPASGADALNPGRGLVRFEPGAPRQLHEPATDGWVGQFLDAAASIAGQFVAGLIGTSDLVEGGACARLTSTDDPAPLQER